MHSSNDNPQPASSTNTDAAKKERFARVLEIFSSAVAVAPELRGTLLDELCAGDLELKREVSLMLDADAGTTQAKLRTGLGSSIGTIEGTFESPDHLKDLPRISGQYRLVRQLGEGGMGVVYLAEQSLPRRFVALKAIRAGLSSRQILERFKRETHILGRLQDPGIAQIFEAGILDDDDSGRAYIVMEYVDGPTLTKYAAEKQLSRESRIDLMIKVCAAVHHAHLKRVIHRDLKPANVLVNSEGNPKILDFGIASLESDSDQHLTITREGQILGTPAYMAPEQVRGEDVDFRADVYALGATLFELLTNTLPHDLTGLNLPSALEKVRTQLPRRALSIEATLDSDLDAIVAMALTKDPSQRYQSADALAEDLRRHQSGEPITARPESGVATLVRLLKRYRLVAAAAVVFIMVLVASTLIFGDLSRRNAQLAKDAAIATQKIAAQAGDLKRALYFSRIGNAEAALAAGDTVKAKARLLECDVANRGWEWRHLFRAVEQSISQVALPQENSAVAFDATCTNAFVHRPGQPWLKFNLETGAAGTELGAGSDVVEAALAPNGKWLVCRTRVGGVELLNLNESTPARAIDCGPASDKAMPQSISRVVWLDEGAEFMCVSSNGKGLVFHVDQEKLVREVPSRKIAAYDAKKRPGHDQWMVTYEDQTVQLRSSRDGALILENKEFPAIPVSIGFSADGMQAAIGCFDGTVAFWDLATNKLRQMRGHKGSIRVMAFSPDGTRVASGGRDRVVKIWDFNTGTLLSTQAGEDVRITAMAWKDPLHIVTAGEGGPIRVFRADAQPVVPVFDCKGDTTIGSDTWNQWSTIAMRSGEIMFFDHRDWKQGTSIECPSLLHTKFASNGTFVATTSSGIIRFYDPISRTLLATDSSIEGEAAYLVASADRSRIAALQGDKGVSLLDLKALTAGKYISLPGIQGCEVLNNGMLLVSRTQPDRLELIDPDSGKSLWKIETPAFIGAYAASGDQKLVAISASRRVIEIHEIATGNHVRSIPVPNVDLGILQFFDHDTRIAGGGQDPVVRAWSLSDGVEVATLTGHRSYVSGLMVCDDSRSLITIDVSGMLRKWRSDVPGSDKAADPAQFSP